MEVQTLSADPLAQQSAGADLDAARASLNQADTAFQQREAPEKVNQLAYLAMRHAQAGEAPVARDGEVVVAEGVAEDEADEVFQSDREGDRGDRCGDQAGWAPAYPARGA